MAARQGSSKRVALVNIEITAAAGGVRFAVDVGGEQLLDAQLDNEEAERLYAQLERLLAPWRPTPIRRGRR